MLTFKIIYLGSYEKMLKKLYYSIGSGKSVARVRGHYYLSLSLGTYYLFILNENTAETRVKAIGKKNTSYCIYSVTL